MASQVANIQDQHRVSPSLTAEQSLGKVCCHIDVKWFPLVQEAVGVFLLT